MNIIPGNNSVWIFHGTDFHVSGEDKEEFPFSNQEISNIDELITRVLSFTQAGWGHWLNGIRGPPPVLLLSILEIE